MIQHERIDERLVKSYSDNGVKIKQAYDRLGKPINENAVYDKAIDVIVNGQPRYDYVETKNIIGQAKDNKLYVLFMKDNKILDYNDYL